MKYARTDLIRTRLARESMQKFRKVVQRSCKTANEFAREAILFYMGQRRDRESRMWRSLDSPGILVESPNILIDEPICE